MQCAVFTFKVACIGTTGPGGEFSRSNTNRGKFSMVDVIADILKFINVDISITEYIFSQTYECQEILKKYNDFFT